MKSKKLYNTKGDLYYEGDTKDGKPDGYGKHEFYGVDSYGFQLSSDGIIHEGHYKDGVPHGQGKLYKDENFYR
jgi:hypothetical protein